MPFSQHTPLRVNLQQSLFEKPAPPNRTPLECSDGAIREGGVIRVPRCAEKAHRFTLKTSHIWPGETFDRLTKTCDRCGEIRGRA